jgi:hypothetical protein
VSDSDDESLVRPGTTNPVPALSLRPNAGMIKAAPGLARVAAVSAWHMVSWSFTASTSGATYVMKRAMDGEPATSIVQDAVTDLRTAAWHALGLNEQHDSPGVPDRMQSRGASASDLQKRGSELMRRANDVHVVEDTHPAFARILTEITPDEARILRFLYLEGPQPSIDVRTNRPLGIGSELVAAGLNMIAEHAGCVHLDRVEPYLTNLSRLGLLEFSKEQVSNPKRYQVVEAQPKVTDALKKAGRMPKMIQRSIHLNAFGAEFCRTCLPLRGLRRRTAEPDAARVEHG